MKWASRIIRKNKEVINSIYQNTILTEIKNQKLTVNKSLTFL